MKSIEQALNEVQKSAVLIKRIISKYRLPFAIVFGLFLIVACYMAIKSAEISVSDLNPYNLFVLITVFPFLSILYGIVGLQISSQIIKNEIQFSFWEAFNINVNAEAAHVLPIPGGAVVRTAALYEKGASLDISAVVITIMAVLWISLASFIASFILIFTNQLTSGGIMLGVSLMIMLPGIYWVFKRSGIQLTASILLHRLVGLAITAARLFFAFAAIGFFVPLMDTFIYSLAVIAGSSAGITPGGLGVSEILSSLIAYAIGNNVSIAFLAILLDRLVSMIVFSTMYLIGLVFSLTSQKMCSDHVE